MVLGTAQQITFTRQSNCRLVCGLVSAVAVIAIASSTTWLVISLAGAGVGAASAPQSSMVIIDTDPGIDDAVAILTTLGTSNVSVLAITCVRGNANMSNVVVNALKLLAVSNNKNIPVYAGSNFGLIETLASDNFFGNDGFGDVPFPNPPSANDAEKLHAAEYLVQTVRANPGQVTLLCLGPLTNIALAINLYPEFLQNVRRLVILGGAIKGQGNMAPGVEFNFFMDPDAASIVLSRAAFFRTQITVVPTETVLENKLTQDWRWNVLGKLKNPVVNFLNKIETSQYARHPSTTYSPSDVYAVSVVLLTDFVTQNQSYYAFVENRSERTNGALLIDYFNLTSNRANINVVTDVNTDVLKTGLYTAFSSFNTNDNNNK